MGGYLKDQSHITAPKGGELKDQKVAPRFTQPAADQPEDAEIPAATKTRGESVDDSNDGVTNVA